MICVTWLVVDGCEGSNLCSELLQQGGFQLECIISDLKYERKHGRREYKRSNRADTKKFEGKKGKRDADEERGEVRDREREKVGVRESDQRQNKEISRRNEILRGKREKGRGSR